MGSLPSGICVYILRQSHSDDGHVHATAIYVSVPSLSTFKHSLKQYYYMY